MAFRSYLDNANRPSVGQLLPRTVRPGSSRAVTAIPDSKTVSGMMADADKAAMSLAHVTVNGVYRVSGASGLLTYQVECALVPRVDSSSPEPMALCLQVHADNVNDAALAVVNAFPDYYVDIPEHGVRVFAGLTSPEPIKQ